MVKIQQMGLYYTLSVDGSTKYPTNTKFVCGLKIKKSK